MSDSLPDPMSESGEELSSPPAAGAPVVSAALAVPGVDGKESASLPEGAGERVVEAPAGGAPVPEAAPVVLPGTTVPEAMGAGPASGGAAVEGGAERLLLILRAVGDPVRYRLLGVLSGGEVLTVAGMARRLKAHPDTMGKHVKVLRRAGVLRRVQREGADGRVKEFQIPAGFRATPGVLDFGVCRVQLGL